MELLEAIQSRLLNMVIFKKAALVPYWRLNSCSWLFLFAAVAVYMQMDRGF